MKNMNDKIENEIKAAFEKNIGSDAIQPPPYMKTRILARFRELNRKAGVLMWKKLIFAGAALAILVVFGLKIFVYDFTSANIGVPLAVKIEVNELKNSQIAFAEIVLPDGVMFYSQKFPEFREKRSLTLDWEIAVKNGHLPFVIEGGSAGRKVIVVRFFDLENKLIAEKSLKISFEKHES
jgi:hypothetical protein